jgi:hypothetical protein
LKQPSSLKTAENPGRGFSDNIQISGLRLLVDGISLCAHGSLQS